MDSNFFASLPIGCRVVVRYRLPAEQAPVGAPKHSDALGDYMGVQGPDVHIQTRSGAVVVPLAEITHAKQVPPPPARRRPRTA